MEKQMNHKTMLVTPDMAVKWLEGNVHNRPLKERLVQRLAADMTAGRWKLSHQGIAFDTEGKLADGQHRLWAIIESKVSIQMVVAFNEDPDVRPYLDSGVPRSVVDSMHIGGMDHANTYSVAVARQMLVGVRTLTIISRQELIAFHEAHVDAIQFAIQDAFQNKRVLRVNPAPVVAVVGRAWFHEDHSRLLEFGRIILDGMVKDPLKDSSAVLLRNWLQIGSPLFERGGRLSRNVLQYMKSQRALVAFLSGEQMRSVYPMKDERWPLPSESPSRRPLKPMKSGKK